MTTPDSLLCERCGADSRVVMIGGETHKGFPTKWPKSTMREGGLYVFIACPKCGEHEQCVATHGDLPPN